MKKVNMEQEFDLKPLNEETEKPIQLTQEEQATKYAEWVEAKMKYNRYSIKHPQNAEFFGKKKEHNDQPSLTIPDQTLPMREILSRFVKGIPVGVKVPVYNGEELLPDLNKMDLAEIQELKESIRDEISALKTKADTQQQETRRKAKEEAAKASGAPSGGEQGRGGSGKTTKTIKKQIKTLENK